jgi:hypothetical protein
MTATQFHSDLLTPGIVGPDDPPPLESGMIALKLDHRGHLAFFEAIPPQMQEVSDHPKPVEWGPLLSLAGLDSGTLQATEPRWNWLAAADTRMAWTGTWPGNSVPVRVEAASLRGRPVAFIAMAPWIQPWRAASATSGREIVFVVLIFLVALAILIGGTVLARKNLREGRGDRAGAVTLGCSVAAGLLGLWLCRVHVSASTGLLGMFLLAVCTCVFYGVLFWAIYLALEPFVRRHWPQTLVSWTTLLGGRVRDRVVGRDVLFGVAIGVAVAVLIRAIESLAGSSIVWPSIDLLLGTRSTMGEILTRGLYAIRTALFMVLLLVLLRVVVRRQWAAALAFVLLFSMLNGLDSDQPTVDAARSFLYFSLLAATVLRWGLTSLTISLVVADLLLVMPATTELSAWYVGQTVLIVALPVVLASWALYTSIGGAHRHADLVR